MIVNENTLPLAIQKDINALKAYHRGELNHPEDCLYMELYGSINSSQHGFEISKEVADYLKNNVQKNDIILTIGAGTVTKIGYMIKE